MCWMLAATTFADLASLKAWLEMFSISADSWRVTRSMS
jgi:hypothetical protein